jgi:hypothetical protein
MTERRILGLALLATAAVFGGLCYHIGIIRPEPSWERVRALRDAEHEHMRAILMPAVREGADRAEQLSRMLVTEQVRRYPSNGGAQ